MSTSSQRDPYDAARQRAILRKRNPDKQGFSDVFRRIANRTSTAVGSPAAFLAAFAVVLVWAVAGPLFAFSDTWQLVINTGTTIVTFLMVFLIQNTQNRDSRALHMKLDELIFYTKGADNEMVALDDLSDEQMDALEEHFHQLARRLGHEDVTGEDEVKDEAREKRTSTSSAPGRGSRRSNSRQKANA